MKIGEVAASTVGMTTTPRDLHVTAAQLALEHIGTHEARGEGFAVVYVHRSPAGDEDVVDISAVYGVRPEVLAYLIEANDGWYGLEAGIPAGEILEVLCRVINEPPTMGSEGLSYLEIVNLDGQPAIESFE